MRLLLSNVRSRTTGTNLKEIIGKCLQNAEQEFTFGTPFLGDELRTMDDRHVEFGKETDYKHTYTSRMLFITDQSQTWRQFEALWLSATNSAIFKSVSKYIF
jgi:hypothetical protein